MIPFQAYYSLTHLFFFYLLPPQLRRVFSVLLGIVISPLRIPAMAHHTLARLPSVCVYWKSAASFERFSLVFPLLFFCYLLFFPLALLLLLLLAEVLPVFGTGWLVINVTACVWLAICTFFFFFFCCSSSFCWLPSDGSGGFFFLWPNLNIIFFFYFAHGLSSGLFCESLLEFFFPFRFDSSIF